MSLAAIGGVFAVHSAVAIVLEVPSGALADAIGRRRVMLTGALLTVLSLLAFAVAQSVGAFMASVALLAAGRALISGSLEAWYVDSLRSLDPLAPLARGLSRGTAAEGIAMALGALAGGALVTASSPALSSDEAYSGYGLAALAAAFAAVVYLAAITALMQEAPRHRGGAHLRQTIPGRTREVFATARAEAAASTIVRVMFVMGAAFGVSLTAVELLWQPRLAELLARTDSRGWVFGAMAAASMLAVAAGASLSPAARRGLGLRLSYLVAIAFGAVCIATLGAPQTPLAFAALYLLVYLGLGVAEPLHFELLNDEVGSSARATLISAESLATQSGALVANLGVGAIAAAQGSAAAWAAAGEVLALTGAAVAAPLRRSDAARGSNRNDPASASCDPASGPH